jgi:hypothetical protein
MFSMITNFYNKKTKGPNLMELFTGTGKLKNFFFLQLEMFDMCIKDDAAQIDTIFKFLPYMHQHECINILHCCNDPCLKVSMLMCVRQDLEYCIDVCCVTRDTHIKHL